MNPEGYKELMDALYRLRVVFLKQGMEPPKAIELGSEKDGIWFRANMPRDLMMETARMGDDRKDARWVCNIMGVEVVLPAQWRADAKGRAKLDHIENYTLYRP